MNNADNKQNSQVENRMKLSDIFDKEFNFMPVLFIKFFCIILNNFKLFYYI